MMGWVLKKKQSSSAVKYLKCRTLVTVNFEVQKWLQAGLLSLFLCFMCTKCEGFITENVLRGESGLKYVWGDALSDPGALDIDGNPYPWDAASKIAKKQRIPRSILEEHGGSRKLMDPEETRAALLRVFEAFDNNEDVSLGGFESTTAASHRKGRSQSHSNPPSSNSKSEGCVPSRLCETTYNTTAPMYGISLTSGQPVTIVQKFPDLLQQVVYQVCKSEECDIVQGKCVQTYLPYLFLVIPLGPVTLTGQDYVLVESGCSCKPKYARRNEEQPQLPFIQSFNASKPRQNKRFG